MADARTVLTVSLREQLSAMRGVAADALPPALLDVTVQRIALPGGDVFLVRPADWAQLRHEEGGAGRPVPYREGMSVPAGAYRDEIEALIVRAHVEHELLLAQVGDELRASLPVDATGVTQAIEVLGVAVGLGAELQTERDRLNRANPAVLHGRVFGRTGLSADTVLAAFADGARVRATLLERLALAIDGEALRAEVGALLEAHPAPAGDGDDDAASRTVRLRATYDAQERAVLLCAARLDASGP